MGNYTELKNAVSNVIKSNGNQEITGEIMKNVLLSIIDNVGNYATYAGIATPNTNPGTPDQYVFYLASNPGIYSNFGGVEVIKGELAIFSNKNGTWTTKKIDFSSSLGNKTDSPSIGGTLWSQFNLLKNRNLARGYWVSNYDYVQVVITEDGYFEVASYNDIDSKATHIIYKDPIIFDLLPKKDGKRVKIKNIGGIQCVYYKISEKDIIHISYTEMNGVVRDYKDYVLLALYNWNSKIVYYTGCVLKLFDKVYYPTDKYVEKTSYKPSLSFNGKTYLSLGDSITVPNDSYAEIIADNFNLVWYNFGVNGCHFTNYDSTKVDFSINPTHPELSERNSMNVIQNQVYRVLQKITNTSDIVPEISESTEFYTNYSYPIYGTNEINAEDVYLVTIACGTNDCSNSKPIGDYKTVENTKYYNLDKKTMWSAIKWAVTVLRKYLPNANIVILAPIQRSRNSNLLEYVNAEVEASVRFSCQCVNMFNEIGIMGEIESMEYRYLSDGLHPNKKGKKLMGSILSSKMLTWFQM